MKKYVADGRKLSNWSVWTALETYLQVRHLTNLPLSPSLPLFLLSLSHPLKEPKRTFSLVAAGKVWLGSL